MKPKHRKDTNLEDNDLLGNKTANKSSGAIEDGAASNEETQHKSNSSIAKGNSE